MIKKCSKIRVGSYTFSLLLPVMISQNENEHSKILGGYIQASLLPPYYSDNNLIFNVDDNNHCISINKTKYSVLCKSIRKKKDDKW